MNESTTITTENESTPKPDVLILPAEYFFVEQVEVPASLVASELDDFAELSMEAMAPFPLEQLRWGFLAAADRSHILIYAALNDRIKRAGHAELDEYVWVLPDFATLHGARFADTVEVVLHGDSYRTSLQFPSGEALPAAIRSLAKDADQGSAEQGSTLSLQALPVELSEKGIPTFSFETIGDEVTSGHWTPLTLDEATLWRADIRPAEFKTVERNTRRSTSLITKLTGYAALFAVFLILIEGLLYAGELWLDTREAKVEAQQSSVRRVEDKQSLMNKLEQVAQNELRPIAILEAANQIRISLGNTGIEYDEAVIEDGNRLTLEGKANTINELNAYTESLRNSGNFKLIDTEQLTRSGKTTFTVTLDYIHSEPTAPSVASPQQAN